MPKATLRRQRALLGFAAVAVVATASILLWAHQGSDRRTPAAARPPTTAGTTVGTAFAQVPGGPVPNTAAAVAQQLVTGTPEQQRAALSAAAAAALPAGTTSLFPAGSRLTLDADGWRQQGDFANATGSLSDSSGKQTRVELGFIAAVDQAGAWKVTFEEALS